MASLEKTEDQQTTTTTGSGVLPATSDTLTQPLFRGLCADNVEELETSELESLCVVCFKNGVTRLLLTKIPMFRDVVLMSFYCPHCGNSNNEIQESSPIQSDGVSYTINITEPKDLNRLVVKADGARFMIPSLDFEIPSNTQKGSVNTLEGYIQSSITDLEKDQTLRKEQHPELASKIEEFVGRLKTCLSVQTPYTIVIDDPSGNSFVENKSSNDSNNEDSKLSTNKYKRTEEQEKELGLFESVTKGEATEEADSTVPHDEVMSFTVNCPNCQMSAMTNMKVVDVPHFKEVILMALSCDYCGHKSNEVKSGSGICEKGKKITLHITEPIDLSRDILKAETASLIIPELEFELKPGTLGGRFTTIEGILCNVKDQLVSSNPFIVGDTATNSQLGKFVESLVEVIEGKRTNIHLILDDPAGNSYLQNLNAPDDDPQMTIEQYERTFEQNDELGLNDIKTENY